MARTVALTVLLLLLTVLVTACGVGSADEGEISDAADTYLRSLASGDTAAACEQLTASARTDLDGGCEAALRGIAARVGSERLEAAADAGIDIEIEIDGATGSAVVRELDARLRLVAVGDDWRISDGHRLESR
jgi:hypothetical protein